MSQRYGKPGGTEKAAILLMSLGEERAAEVVGHLAPKEVRRLGEAMAAVGSVSREQAREVVQDCARALETETALGLGAGDYLERVLTRALGEERAGTLLDRILPGRNLPGFERLKWMEPRTVAEAVRREHPQVIAVVLACLDADLSAAVLSVLPEEIRADLVMRVAALDGIRPDALRELDAMLDRQFSGHLDRSRSAGIGGEKTAAELLNLLDASLEYGVLDRVRQRDPALGRRIEERMFGFEKLAEVDGRGIQALLREVSSETLVLALKGADEAVRWNIFRNMSRRAGEVLQEDLEARGPVRVADVEAAQTEVLAIARRMQEAGELFFGGGSGFL